MEKFLQLIHLKPRSLFGIALIGLFLLFNPYSLIAIFGLVDAVNEYRSIIGIITLISIVFFIIQLFPWINTKYSISQYNKQILNNIDSLSKDESYMLLLCIRSNSKSLSLPLSHSTANLLASKGIMNKASGTGNMTAWPYTVSDIIWNKIKKNENILPHIISNKELKQYEGNMYDPLYN
ncbi:MAG: hypothetical protein DRG78_00025 [Epsilonproteobacteria bacterium]|nr:MAG: hypothetical protein DRG78_00025 [Campylobacterota bacterium]